MEQHCAKEQHKPLSAPLLRTVKISFLFLCFYPQEFHSAFKWYNFFQSLVSFPFCWEKNNRILYYHAFHDLWCSSQALVALVPPWVPYLEQAAAHVGQGGALGWNWAQIDSSLSWNHFSLMNGQKWPHTECKGNMFTYSCVTQGLLIEKPFPCHSLAIPPPDMNFKLSLYTAIFFPRIPHLPDVPGHLYVRKPWHGCHRHISVTVYSVGSCFHLLQHFKLLTLTFLMVAASNVAHNPCSEKPPGLKQGQISFTHFTSKTPWKFLSLHWLPKTWFLHGISLCRCVQNMLRKSQVLSRTSWCTNTYNIFNPVITMQSLPNLFCFYCTKVE